MITMRDWLMWRRCGVNVFKFNERSALDAYCVQDRYTDFDTFVNDLRYFFLGGTVVDDDADDGDGGVIRDETLWAIIARVPDWLELTWHECTMYARASIEINAAAQAQIMCLIHNVHCDNKKGLLKPDDFNSVVQARKAKAERDLRRQYCGDDWQQARLAEFMEVTEPQTIRQMEAMNEQG